MAVRWGAGEETLTTCNMDIFPLDKLLETTGLHSGDPLDTLQGCLDPSILSIFEETPTIETRGLEHESEATLLTALTEILDNVDDENLSPFDTLPESDLLSGQKGREHSPLGRLCLSRSSPEKDALCGTKTRSTGKTLPRIQQRSDGEEEEDSLTPSPGRLELSSDSELLDWEGFPITFEQGGEGGVSVSLGDLVRHMHPYCMAISLDDDKGEQMLPEGGILLEVVDQGENGEPILAIPEMDHPISGKLDDAFSNSYVFDEADDFTSDSSEQIVVDDDEDAFVKTLLKDAENETCLNVKDKMTSKKPKDKIKDKSSSRRKRKKKSSNSPAACLPEPTEDRVLRSAALKKAPQEPPKKADKSHKEDKNKNNPSQDCAATTTTAMFTKPKNITSNQTEGWSENTTTTTLPLIPVSSRQDTVLSNSSAEMGLSSCPPKAEGVQQPETIPNLSAPAPEKQESSVAGFTASKAGQAASCTAVLSQSTLVVSELSCPLPTVTAEPKPKSLSLAEYRRLRQQKKPAPMENHDDNSTKWPSLPELPKELPPIPYLPDPSPKDPRRSRPQSAKDMEEVKAAWQPRGPGAPPTPEALLAPPAYMVSSSNKFSATAHVLKPSQTPYQTIPTRHTNTSGATPNLHTEQATTGDEERVTEGPQSHPTSATITTDVINPAANVSPPTVSHNAAASPETKASLNSTEEASKPIDSCGKDSSSPAHHLKSPSQGESGISGRKSSAANPVEAKSPTQELIEAFTSEMGIEAADLTSLLEQFEETQAKEEQSVPEVSGRAAAVGNSSTELVSEKTVVERVRANDLSSTAALTPPATPPHHLWKTLTPVSLLDKSKAAETTKSSLSKVIEIEAQPLPSAKSHCNFTSAAGSVALDLACKDHDYCLPNKGTSSGEAGKRWNVKQHSSITIKPIKQPATQALHHAKAPTVQSATTCVAKAHNYPPAQLDLKTDNLEKSSVLETPDASPTHEDAATIASPRRGPFGRPFGRSYRQSAASRTPSPKERPGGRSRIRGSRHFSSSRSISSESDSHSSRSRSRSYSPPKKRYRPCHSRSSSSSSSRSSSQSSSRSSSTSVSRSPQCKRRCSYSSSRSGSWSRSRSRSQSPPTQEQWSGKRRLHSPSYKNSYGTSVKTNYEVKRYKEKAIEERRVVYVGRIRGTMTQKELKERFSYFGEIEECTLHFRDHGDNYGFVTYYNTNDAFMAIENGSRLRKPDELPFDLCFGGRRQFCQTSYADLDSSKDYEPLPSRNKYHALDFDTLLKQAQQNLKR